jgi:Co/Zn/Cd efflux system component
MVINAKRMYLLVMVVIGWFALIAQFMIHLQASKVPQPESLIRFFSYFTILTNLLVIICFTVLLFKPTGTGFFNSPSVQTALILYITVVGLVYNIVLRDLWHSEGLQVLLHDLLHTVIPLGSIIYWWLWTDARQIELMDLPPWLIYPTLYAIYILARGRFSHWYPYPFMDVSNLGMTAVLMNSGLLVLTFLFFACFFVFVGQRKRA